VRKVKRTTRDTQNTTVQCARVIIRIISVARGTTNIIIIILLLYLLTRDYNDDYFTVVAGISIRKSLGFVQVETNTEEREFIKIAFGIETREFIYLRAVAR